MKQGTTLDTPFPALAPSRPLKLTMIGWGVFFAWLVVQCLAHQAFVQRVAVDAWDSVVWSIREWGVWLVLTPVLLRAIGRLLDSGDWLRPAVVCVACLVAALGFRVGLNVIDAQPPVGSLVYFLPKYLGAWMILMVAGAWLSRGRSAHRGSGVEAESAPRTLLVHTGRDQCLLDVARIEAFSAAKNYVDVRCGGRTYLVRSTLRQIEEGLPPGEFIRTHRSHLVRTSAIDRIRLMPSGTGLVILKDGSTVALSKKHYRGLERFRSLSG